ncbi:MAG: hypothetical protein ACI814_005222, partial [Mariniblastus sp.]
RIRPASDGMLSVPVGGLFIVLQKRKTPPRIRDKRPTPEKNHQFVQIIAGSRNDKQRKPEKKSASSA